jgi:hypothetical protein
MRHKEPCQVVGVPVGVNRGVLEDVAMVFLFDIKNCGPCKKRKGE